MYEVNLKPVSNRADWIETVELVNDDTDEVIRDLSGVTAKLDIRSRFNRCTHLTATTENGKISILPLGVIQWRFSPDEMRRLEEDTYEIGLTITRDGITEQELIGTLPVIDGVVRP